MPRLSLLSALLLFVGCGTTEPPQEGPILEPGTYNRSVTTGGRAHSYRLYVPPGYDAQVPTPLVFALHGGSGNADQVDGTLQIQAKADAAGFLLIFPNGYDASGLNLRTWNAGACCGAARDRAVDHVAAISAMLDATQAEANVEARRVYATGHSNGGMMSYRLACDLSGRIAAIAPNAAYQMTVDVTTDPPTPVFACTPTRPVPVLHFHGLADQCAPFAGGPSTGLDPSDRPPAQQSLDFWVQHNGCDATPVVTYQQGAATCVSYTGCTDGATVTRCTIEGAGHTWPGSPNYASRAVCGGTTTTDLIANDALWDFFQAHPLPE